MEKQKTPVFIDTDPGVDDAIAIMLAASARNLQIVGLSAVDGNVEYEKTQKNLLEIASFLNLDCPVARGASTQLRRPYTARVAVHGINGLGTLELPPATKNICDSAAWELMYEKALEFKGKLEIISIAPMTNLAHLIINHPDVVPYIARIISMGGTMWLGNRSKFSEFNYWVDPAAAAVVYESGIPIVMAGLNVTMASGVPLRLTQELTKGNSKYARAMHDALRGYEDYFPNKNCEDSVIIHDAIAVAYAMDPSCCTTHDGYVRICTDDLQYGRSVVRFGESYKNNCTLITDIDIKRYEQMLVDMMAYYDTRE